MATLLFVLQVKGGKNIIICTYRYNRSLREIYEKIHFFQLHIDKKRGERKKKKKKSSILVNLGSD